MPEKLNTETDPTAEFNRVSISKNDMEEAGTYLDAYSSDQAEVIRRALLTAAIVAYSRPFKRSNCGTLGQSTGQLSDFAKAGMNERQRALHDRIITLRDQGVAHSDYHKKPTQRVPSAGRSVMTWSKTFDVLAELIDVTMFRNLARQIENQCIDKLFELSGQASLREQPELPESVSVRDGGITVDEGELRLQAPLQKLIGKDD